MIVSCISAKEPFVDNPANNIGDVSPATFRVLFDEGIELQNAQIELISAKVSRLNEIVISPDHASFSVRMGDEDICNQIKCKIPSGIYKSTETLGEAIAKSLNDNMPANVYRGGPESDLWNLGVGLCGWVSTVVGTNINLTWNRCAFPAPLDPASDPIDSIFTEIQNDESKVNQLGDAVTQPVVNTNVGLVNNWTQYECSDDVKTNIRSNVLVPTWAQPNSNQNQYDFVQGLDLGSQLPDYLSRKSWDQFGPFEGRGGAFSAVVKPIRCVTRSSYDVGFNGFNPAIPTAKPSYWTFEFRENFNDDGSIVSGGYKYGSLFPSDSLKHSRPNPPLEEIHTEGLPTINGCLNHSVTSIDTRGGPYNVVKRLQLPYSLNATAGQPTLRRRLTLKTTWTGQIEFGGGETLDGSTVGQAGIAYINTPVPDHYTFQMNNLEPAYSLCKRNHAETDKVRVRMTHQGLMAGLPQQNVLNGPIVHTVVEAPLIQPPETPSAVPTIQYIRGTVGRYNSWNGDAAVEGNIRDTNEQGHLNVATRSAKDFRLPFYKIIEVDNDPSKKYGLQPTKILTMDSGEYIIPGVDTDSTLWINDPNTWRFSAGNGAGNPSNTLLQEMWRVMPAAADIMYPTLPAVEKTVAYRYPSFNMGLVRDDIHNTQIVNANQFIRENFSKFGKSQKKAFDVPKTLEISLQSQITDSDGATIPAAAGGNGCIRAVCSQLQPSRQNDDYYQKNFDVTDEKKVIVNAQSNNWNQCIGDGGGTSNLQNWTNFTGVNAGNSAVKIDITLDGVYTYKIAISHTVDVTANPIVWQERTCLCRTGVTRSTNNGVAYNKMESFMKARFFPLHPICSILPASTEDKNSVWIRARGTPYPLRSLGDGVGQVNNYRFNEKNILGVATDKWRTYQNIQAASTVPAGNPSGDRPRIMLKFSKLEQSQIVLPPIPPALPPTGSVLEKDFVPQNSGSLYNAGFDSVYYQQGNVATFAATSAPTKQAYLPTYVVEIKNLPLTGYISKSFDFGRLDEKKGSGQRRPVVGVVPAFEQSDVKTGESLVNYLYNAPFSQPVNLRLPTKQFFYHFDIELRSILDGQLLHQLIHTSEIVIRIIPMQ